MTATIPEPDPATPEAGPLNHIRAWFERDVAPDIAKIRALAPELATVAKTVTALAEAADPAAAPAVAALAADAKKAAAVIGKIAGELAASGV